MRGCGDGEEERWVVEGLDIWTDFVVDDVKYRCWIWVEGEIVCS